MILKRLLLILISLIPLISYAQEAQYEVYAIEFASLINKIPVSSTAIGSDSKDSTSVNYMIWLLMGNNGKVILVDAGFNDTAFTQNMTFVRPDKMLDRISIKASDVTDIIITHPHWDHIGGIDLFPNARVWIQKEDYDYFVGDAWQSLGIANGFNTKDVFRIVQKNIDKKLNFIKGDNVEVFSGIKVFTGSKHTYECQYVMVNTKTDKVIIASDNSWFYYNLIHLLPIPVTHDADAYKQNLIRMKSQISNIDLILPGHDPAVMKKFPEVIKGVVKVR